MNNFFSMDSAQETARTAQVWIRRHRVLVFFVFIILACSIGLSAYGMNTKGRVLPGSLLGGVPIGDLTSAELEQVLNDLVARRSEEGIEVTVQTNSGTPKTFTILPEMQEDGSAWALFTLDVPAEVAHLTGTDNSWFSIPRGFVALRQRFFDVPVVLQTGVVYEEVIALSYPEALATLESEVRNARIDTIKKEKDETYTYTIVPEQQGRRVPIGSLVADVTSDLSTLSPFTAAVVLETVEPTVQQSDVEKLNKEFGYIFAGGPIVLMHTDPNKKRDIEFTLYPERLSQLLAVDMTRQPPVYLSSDAFAEYIADVVSPSVDIAASDARFRIGVDNKVEEFLSAKTGVTTDVTSTIAAVEQVLAARLSQTEASSTVQIVTTAVEPSIATGSVNDLGIKEILGVGYSSYKGSPTNRIKNVRFAVKEKLNGMLIPPGETFSMVKALEPFTIEGGYLSELVIKGNEIKPEVGGGLCQVGSTMFRAAMNAGMPIVERRNHSLVISYYNDHRNGKPGVDATIYDPAPDFKFKNDTEHHILITTEMNESTSELWFTLWGTSDGRKAYYTEPTVDTWIPYGPDILTETTKLAPGEKSCQTPHSGAVARFTYVREMPGVEKEEREFVSHYRALPRICLVGVAELSSETDAPVEGDDGGSGEVPEEIPAEAPETPVPAEVE